MNERDVLVLVMIILIICLGLVFVLLAISGKIDRIDKKIKRIDKEIREDFYGMEQEIFEEKCGDEPLYLVISELILCQKLRIQDIPFEQRINFDSFYIHAFRSFRSEEYQSQYDEVASLLAKDIDMCNNMGNKKEKLVDIWFLYEKRENVRKARLFFERAN